MGASCSRFDDLSAAKPGQGKLAARELLQHVQNRLGITKGVGSCWKSLLIRSDFRRTQRRCLAVDFSQEKTSIEAEPVLSIPSRANTDGYRQTFRLLEL